MGDLRVIGDVGGTNARFALAQGGRYRNVVHVEVDHYPSLHDAMSDYLGKLAPIERADLSGAIAVAGPVLGDSISLTNKAWSFSIAALKQSLKLRQLVVVNDFAATALAIPHLPEKGRSLVGPSRPDAEGPIAIIGPGTGLGMSALIPNGSDWVLMAGEGGHATLPASTKQEAAIVDMLRRRWDHVSAERVCSGAGLVNLYEALCTIDGAEPLMLTPADVTKHAMDGTDDTCVRAFAHFCEFLGAVAGDLALTTGALGGVYIAGGILLRFSEAFRASAFRSRFEAKGRFTSMLSRIPTYLILDESPALLGLSNMPL